MDLEEWRDTLVENFETGIILAEEGDRIPIETVLEVMEDNRLFEELTEDEKDIVLEMFRDSLGFDQDQPPFHSYEMEGTPGTPGEGTIQVEVFTTDLGHIYLRKYHYSDGATSWSIGPSYLPDEEDETGE